MSLYMPINLLGQNLGLRQRHLNTLVTEAYTQEVSFPQIQELPDKTPVDRLFKIDLASKLRNVDYILRNIKDEDMLYVSRALKAKWLLNQEYQGIINPKSLEETLYPYMVTTAVSKFKNWLYLYLKDSERCKGFYLFYSEINLDYALKFVGSCKGDFILSEVPKILEKLSPHHFKILCEKCPEVAKIYFGEILNNEKLKIIFLDNHEKFYNSLKVVLKLDADIFFEITEKYFDHRFSRSLTKHIITNHRERFDLKPELYAGMLLNKQTLAECLSTEDCKDIVLKLARAYYIGYRVDYKFVEPFIKRLPLNERAAFKKLVFVEKAIGERIETWPYEKPSLPTRKDYEIHVFKDREYPLYKYNFGIKIPIRKKYGKFELMECIAFGEPKTLLDKIFDEYRFYSFERTLFELRKRVKQESSSQNRQYMMLVLVSKSGGQLDLIASLLQLLEQHSNESANVRAAVVRSLVKRAAVWRLPQHSWDVMLQFARGLGLDGKNPEADCREGLHAVVIRSLLLNRSCEPTIRDAFLKEFSRLDEYTTNRDEHKIIRVKLPELLLAAANAEPSPATQAELLTSVLDLLQTYKVDIENSPLIPAVAALGKCDPSVVESLRMRLYKAKIARRIFFRDNFTLIQTDASYLNALRHDTSVVNVSRFVDLIERDKIRPEQFLRKLATYFAECSGMMECYLTEMRERVLTNPSIGKSIARPMCLLQGSCLDYLGSLDITNKAIAQLAAAIRANMHVGRPKLDMTGKSLSEFGAKAVANKVLVCPKVKVDGYIQDLFKWNRTLRVALVLAERIDKEADAYVAAVALKPMVVLKTALKYLRRRTDVNPRVWEILQNLINNFDQSQEKYLYLRMSLTKLEKIPPQIKPGYCTILFNVLKNDHHHEAMRILSYIEELLFDVKEDFLEDILLDFLKNYDYEQDENFYTTTKMYVRILVKCFMLCKSEEIQQKRFITVGEPFLIFLSLFLNKLDKDFFEDIFETVLISLQYNKVFFDETYISPLPVLENIISWMRQHLPVELHFNTYVRVHLIMLYFKSIRLSIQSKRDILTDEKRRLTEGISVVGHIFGKKIAQEIKQLMENYFESAIELYRVGIEGYFNDYFHHDVTKHQFMKAILQGMVAGSMGDEVRAALYLLQDQGSNLGSKDTKELFGTMKNIVNEKFQYFLFSKF